MHLHCPQRLRPVGDLCRIRPLAHGRRRLISERNVLVRSPAESFELEATHLPTVDEGRGNESTAEAGSDGEVREGEGSERGRGASAARPHLRAHKANLLGEPLYLERPALLQRLRRHGSLALLLHRLRLAEQHVLDGQSPLEACRSGGDLRSEERARAGMLGLVSLHRCAHGARRQTQSREHLASRLARRFTG